MQKILQVHDQNLGNNLRTLRRKCGLTQHAVCAQLATRYGRSMLQANYAQIETGTRNIYVSDLIALKNIFQCSFEDIFFGLTPAFKCDSDK